MNSKSQISLNIITEQEENNDKHTQGNPCGRTGGKWRKSFMLTKALKNLQNQMHILLKCLSS